MASKNNYYRVWKGYKPGIYTSWDACKAQVVGFPDAQYKGFRTLAEAVAAKEFISDIVINNQRKSAPCTKNKEDISNNPILESISVDAACSGNPGRMEYRGVETKTGKQIFHQGPFENGTNNIGEFLALVHGLALLKQMNNNCPIYTDSITALAWVRAKKAKTKLVPDSTNAQLFDLIQRAEKWLLSNEIKNKIIKWDTAKWGEIPADFGRK